jgi:hypothetical protein
MMQAKSLSVHETTLLKRLSDRNHSEFDQVGVTVGGGDGIEDKIGVADDIGVDIGVSVGVVVGAGGGSNDYRGSSRLKALITYP